MRTSMLIFVSLVALMFVATGCYEVVYTVETKGPCIKFEDAMYDQDPDEIEEDLVEDCLGEDGLVEADLFIVQVEGDVTAIEVTVKAGRGKDSQVSDTIVPGVDNDVEILGFTIVLEDYYEGEYWFSVLSDDIDGSKKRNGTPALSNITFCFGEGVEVISPEEGSAIVERSETEDELP